MRDDRLHKAYEHVRKTFFPEWDREHEWRILECPEELGKLGGRGVDGVCDEQAKIIKISMARLTEDPDDLHELLIHEICHCNARGHGEDWQDAMLAKAKIADKLGQEELAERIRKDIDASVILERIAEDRLERMIRRHVQKCVEQCRGLSFEDLKATMVREYNMPPDILEEWVDVCRGTYERSKIGKTSKRK